MNTKVVKLNELLPNPYRNLEHYKLDEGKINELVNSYNVSGYWPIIIVRKNKTGKYETAYGEHRKEAYRRKYGKHADIEVILLDLSDEMMLKMMANENSESWTSAFINDMETIQSVVKAFAAKPGMLPAPKTQHADLRVAPSFAKGEMRDDRRAFVYSAQTIGEFLGWLEPSGKAQEKIKRALQAWEFIEKDILKIEQFIGLNNEKAQALLVETGYTQKSTEIEKRILNDRLSYVENEARKAKTPVYREKMEREAEVVKQKVERVAAIPKQFAAQLSTRLKDKNFSTRAARHTTEHALTAHQIKPLPSDREFISRLAQQIRHFLHPRFDKDRIAALETILGNQASIDQTSIRLLMEALELVIEHCQDWHRKLEDGKSAKSVTPAVKALPVK